FLFLNAATCYRDRV
ncbi:putative membrane protein, partial [Chlamydia psittaci 84-8471/1]